MPRSLDLTGLLPNLSGLPILAPGQGNTFFVDFFLPVGTKYLCFLTGPSPFEGRGVDAPGSRAGEAPGSRAGEAPGSPCTCGSGQVCAGEAPGSGAGEGIFFSDSPKNTQASIYVFAARPTDKSRFLSKKGRMAEIIAIRPHLSYGQGSFILNSSRPLHKPAVLLSIQRPACCW